ncbi:hypothetical protein [Profundibacterium mesophilum]|uniref:Uncharacterized protein n=1 Tax=Profundibacterium mesophilum KAUST100406-0324 TaxID=1037889 RepID=A0A921NW63_9RHOB|nr:hypothetical protein [Profundibacterium mesophilum]KAF0675879.1 hypothetical protein PMES_01769 [Profundibacterium mesophilum KAUST100406-0324]
MTEFDQGRPRRGASAAFVRIGVIALLTLALLFPALRSGAPFAFGDTRSYYVGGGVAIAVLGARLGLGPAQEGAEPGKGRDDGSGGDDTDGDGDTASPEPDAKSVANVRSVPFAVYVNAAMRAGGVFAPVILAALGTAWLIWMVLHPLAPLARLGVGIGMAAVTNAGFFAGQIMPDILAAWLILVPLVVLRRGGAIGIWTGGLLGLFALWAVLSHYSHIPLAATMGVALGLWLAWRRRWIAALAIQVPLLAALALNIGMSGMLPGKASVAPARLPILLARSLADGVAVRYLTENCDDVAFTLCELYPDGFPQTVAEALWEPGNIKDRASGAQMAEVADQEVALVWEVFLYDPPAQLWALLGNAAEQFTRIGLSEVHEVSYEIAGPARLHVDTLPRDVARFERAERIERWAALAAALALLLAAIFRPRTRAPIAMLVTGLAANALICGGLSAPADRYQGRIIWVAVLLALAFAAEELRRRPPARREAGPA